MSSSYPNIYAAVRRIPRGRVATYGQIATLVGVPRQARLVGYALSAIPESNPIPWHRVVNAAGEISLRGASSAGVTQRLMLEREGVRFDARGRIELKRFRWEPRAAKPASRSRNRPHTRP